MLYPDWFTEVSINLENEMHENLLIANIQKESYLRYIKKRILEDIPFESHTKIIDKWVETYGLEGLKFPYLDYKDIKILIASSLDGDYLNQKEKHLYKEIQVDFYCHAAIIEKDRILDFIDDLLKTENEECTNPTTCTTCLLKVLRATTLITFLVEVQTPMSLSTIFQTVLNTKRTVIFSFQST